MDNKQHTPARGDAKPGGDGGSQSHLDIKPSGANPHYRLIGGEEAVRRLVERFYALMDELPEAREIRALHPPDLTLS